MGKHPRARRYGPPDIVTLSNWWTICSRYHARLESSCCENPVNLHRTRASPSTVTGPRQTVRYRQLMYRVGSRGLR